MSSAPNPVELLQWLLRRHRSENGANPAEVVLVRADALLAVPADSTLRFYHEGAQWAVRAVAGPLSLRAALAEPGPHLLVLGGEHPPPLDVSERAWLRRPLVVEARDLVACAAGRPCAPLNDGALEGRLRTDWETFRQGASRWRFRHPLVVRSDIEQILAGLTVAAERRDADAVLAEWLLAVAEARPHAESSERMATLLARRTALLSALGPATNVAGEWADTSGDAAEAIWLVAALGGDPNPSHSVNSNTMAHTSALRPPGSHAKTDTPWEVATAAPSLRAILSGGALAPVPAALSSYVEQATGWPRDASVAALARLVRAALRRVLDQQRDFDLDGWLAPAERVAATLDAADEIRDLTWLRAGWQALERGALARLAEGELPDAAEVARWREHPRRWAQDRLLDDLVALARHARSDEPAPERPEDWARLARTEIAWVDRAHRAVRHRLAALTEHAREATQTVLNLSLARRDQLNAAFARQLAADELRTYRNGGLRDALPVHLVGKAVVRPLLDAGHRVLLLVLDGCDLSTFVELLDTWAPIAQPTRPPVGALEAWGDGLLTGFSPVPTLTAIGRRALFGGEIPQNAALTSEEAVAADAATDHSAFARNPAWRDYRKRLFLKGDLGGNAASAVVAALRMSIDDPQSFQLVGVVFNAVDDALSSKETTALGPWDHAHLGEGPTAALRTALAEGWQVVVTADHGHSPHWSTDRKVPDRKGSDRNGPDRNGPDRKAKDRGRAGQRFRPAEDHVGPEAGQWFSPAPWRSAGLMALTRVGAWFGQQHIGYHGGAGIEEVTVPLCLLGPKRAEGWVAPRPWFVDRDRLWTPTPGGLEHAPAPVDRAEAETWQAAAETSATPSAKREVVATPSQTTLWEARPIEAAAPPTATTSQAPKPPPPKPQASDAVEIWLETVADEGFRRVLRLIHRHGSLAENEVLGMLGSGTYARRFARAIDQLNLGAPFRIEIEPIQGINRYVKKTG